MKVTFWDLLADSVIVQGILTIGVVGTWLALIVMGRSAPPELTNIVGLVVGFFFGGKYAMATVKAKLATQIAQMNADNLAARTTTPEDTNATNLPQ